MNEPSMPSLLVAHHRPGFYFRVLQEAAVQADDEIVRVHRDPQQMTVAETDGLLYLPHRSARAAYPGAQRWLEELVSRAARRA